MEDYMPKASQIFLQATPQRISRDLRRQAASKTLMVGVSSIEIRRNKIPKKVKLLDVKLSFSYQENFTTETTRLERQLNRHGDKWVWHPSAEESSILSFPYAPGDRVNMNLGIIVYKTKEQSMLSCASGKSAAAPVAVGTVTDCIALAKNNGVGMGLPLNSSISHNVKLNFNLNGFGHHLTIKLKLDLESESRGFPILWLRPSSSEKKFRSQKTPLQIIRDTLPPRPTDGGQEDFSEKLYVYTNQRLVNYLRSPILECWSVRANSSTSEIPAGIQVRQVSINKPVAYLIPIVENVDGLVSRNLRFSILVLTTQGAYCMCSAKWKSSDKFDFKIHYFESGETWGQRIKWASRDFLDIDHVIVNSTGHEYILNAESECALEDLCVGLCMKLLVRWSDQVLPWKREDAHRPLSVVAPSVTSCSTSHRKHLCSSSSYDINTHIDDLPSFLESQDLAMFCEVEEMFLDLRNNKTGLVRHGSGSSYGECQESDPSRYNVTMKSQQVIAAHYDSDRDDYTSGFVEDFVYSDYDEGSYID